MCKGRGFASVIQVIGAKTVSRWLLAVSILACLCLTRPAMGQDAAVDAATIDGMLIDASALDGGPDAAPTTPDGAAGSDANLPALDDESGNCACQVGGRSPFPLEGIALLLLVAMLLARSKRGS